MVLSVGWLFLILGKGNYELWQGGGWAPALTSCHPSAADIGCGSCGYIRWWGCRSRTRPCAPGKPCTWAALSGPSQGGWRPTGKHLEWVSLVIHRFSFFFFKAIVFLILFWLLVGCSQYYYFVKTTSFGEVFIHATNTNWSPPGIPGLC